MDIRNCIRTHQNTFLSYDHVKGNIFHGYESEHFVRIHGYNENKMVLKFNDKYIMPVCNNESFTLSSTPFNFNLWYLPRGFGLGIYNKYFSAYPHGKIILQDNLLQWERFESEIYVQSNSTLYDYFMRYKNLRNGNPLILICCCGRESYGSEYFNTDYLPNYNKDIFVLDISRPFPLPDELFDYIYIEHGLEHVDITGVINFISESYRVLKNNGVLRISSPGLDNWIMFYIIENDLHTLIKDISMNLYNKSAVNIGVSSKALCFNNALNSFGHKCVLDLATYKSLLNRFHFTKISEQSQHISNWSILNNIERHKGLRHEFETIVLEAIK